MEKGTTEQEQIAQTRSQLANRKSKDLIIGCVPTLNYSIHFNECVHIVISQLGEQEFHLN